MTDTLSDVESFGAKLNGNSGIIIEEISDLVDAMDASGGDPPESLEDVFTVTEKPNPFKYRIKSSNRRPSYDQPPAPSQEEEPTPPKYKRPEGTPQPLIIICEDPNYCPPPAPNYGYPPYRNSVNQIQVQKT